MRLLLATGDSAHSELVLKLGLHLLRTSKSSQMATVLTVVRRDGDRAEADRILAQAYDWLQAAGILVKTKTRRGKPANEIVAEATESTYDLIVVGEWQTRRLVPRRLGSTTAQVVEQAPCPVIIAKGQIEPIERILLCDSGAESPSLLNRLTTQLNKLITGEIEITVLHVMSQITAGPGVPGHQLRAEAQELIAEREFEGEILAQDLRLLNQPNLHPQPKIRHGFVVDEIVEEARSGDYNLVVIGAYRGGGWQRFLLDNLAQQIIEQVDRPVLALR